MLITNISTLYVSDKYPERLEMEKTSDSTKIRVDFVIPTLNEEENLPLLLSSISAQQLNENVEISKVIVVDNGSNDKTVEIADSYGATILFKPGYSIADLRNIGAKMTTGDIIIFSDADNILLNKDVVNNVVLQLACDNLSASGPDGLLPYGDTNWLQKMWYFHTSILTEQQHAVDVENLSSGFFAIKASAFQEIGGFNGGLSIGEDSEISNRLIINGHRLVKSKNIIVHNSGHPRTIIQFIKREYWHGDSINHLIVHKNIDLLTVYLFMNSLLWVSLIICTIYTKSYVLILANMALIVAVPSYKAAIKVKLFNRCLFQLIFIYLLYASSRSLALFKTR